MGSFGQVRKASPHKKLRPLPSRNSLGPIGGNVYVNGRGGYFCPALGQLWQLAQLWEQLHRRSAVEVHLSA